MQYLGPELRVPYSDFGVWPGNLHFVTAQVIFIISLRFAFGSSFHSQLSESSIELFKIYRYWNHTPDLLNKITSSGAQNLPTKPSCPGYSYQVASWGSSVAFGKSHTQGRHCYCPLSLCQEKVFCRSR